MFTSSEVSKNEFENVGNLSRNKYCSIKELLNENLVDMIFIAESKLDDTFRNSEFNVENYHLRRADRNASGGEFTNLNPAKTSHIVIKGPQLSKLR
jgi:hypothetical protein